MEEGWITEIESKLQLWKSGCISERYNNFGQWEKPKDWEKAQRYHEFLPNTVTSWWRHSSGAVLESRGWDAEDATLLTMWVTARPLSHAHIRTALAGVHSTSLPGHPRAKVAALFTCRPSALSGPDIYCGFWLSYAFHSWNGQFLGPWRPINLIRSKHGFNDTFRPLLHSLIVFKWVRLK